jgi:hypothetical protein
VLADIEVGDPRMYFANDSRQVRKSYAYENCYQFASAGGFVVAVDLPINNNQVLYNNVDHVKVFNLHD